jgi:hypothetical protein
LLEPCRSLLCGLIKSKLSCLAYHASSGFALCLPMVINFMIFLLAKCWSAVLIYSCISLGRIHLPYVNFEAIVLHTVDACIDKHL